MGVIVRETMKCIIGDCLEVQREPWIQTEAREDWTTVESRVNRV